MGQPIQPGDLQFTTREFYLDGDNDYAKGSTLSFQDLDTTLIFLSNSIANVSPSLNTSSLLLTASADLNVITFTKGDGVTQFAVTIDTGSAVTVNTGSLLLTASVASNTITFTKGDGITQFDITVETGSGQTYTAGNGLNLIGNVFSSKVLTVNGQNPDNLGNITTALTAVETGTSASLVQSSSGTVTGSIINGTVWVISGDGDTTKNGDTYIFKSGSVGQWYQISPLDEVAADARYVRLSSTSLQTITSSLLISGSTTFSGSLFWSGASDLGGAANSVLVLGDDGKLYTTGAYGGGGGGGTPGSPDRSFQYNDAGGFSGATNFTVTGNDDIFNMSGSLIVSNSLNIVGTSRVTGSLIVSNSLNTIGTHIITGSLIVSSSSNVIGTSRITGSLIVSTSLSVIGTGSITGSLSVSSSTNGQTVLQVTGTGSLTSSPLVQIAGQNGGFVQIYDSNSGSLFSVNNNTGTAIVDVRSTGQTLIGSNTFQGTYDSVGIASFSGPTQSLLIPGYLTSSFNMLMMEYVAISGSYGKTGTLTGIMSGSTFDSAAPAARTFGTSPTNNINFGVSMSGQYYTIIATSDVNGWFIKGIVRAI